MFPTRENSVYPLTTNHAVFYNLYYQNICTPFKKSVLWFYNTLKKYDYKYYLELFS